MQLSFISLFAAFAAGIAMASPMPLHHIRACDAAACAIALGPAAVGCVGAAATVGANPIADAGCVAGVLNSVVNTPAACAGCGGGVSGAVSSAENAVGNAVGSAVNDVTSAIDSIF